MKHHKKSQTAEDKIKEAEEALKVSIFPRYEACAHVNTERVLMAMKKYKLNRSHFFCVAGYGREDVGRGVLEKIFAYALESEAALVRPHIVSGTHAIALALNGCLERGDTMLSITGAPYVTVEEIIGLRGKSKQSLHHKGISYQEINIFDKDKKNTITFNEEEILKIKNASLIYLQRSRGYSERQAMTIDLIKNVVKLVKKYNSTAIIMVDNCYGEFLEDHEPTSVGVDIISGSLIKNLGAGLAPAGGYVAGRKDLIHQVKECLNSIGGINDGYMFELKRIYLQGLFLAPTIVKEAIKGICLSAYILDSLGIKSSPHWSANRSDVIQTIYMEKEEDQEKFAKLVQEWLPISSNFTPVPRKVAGYDSKLVETDGAFIDFSSIELSADGPVRPPYIMYLQGGLVYSHARILMLKFLEQAMTQNKVILE